MTLGNRLTSELDDIVGTAAGSGDVELEVSTSALIEATMMAFRDSLVLGSVTGASTKGIVFSVISPRVGRPSHSTVGLGIEIEQLRTRVAALEQELSQLKDSLPDEHVIVLRSMSREEAKQEILELFHSGETLYYSDIAKRLQIDLPLVVEICQELREEGEIEVDANSV